MIIPVQFPSEYCDVIMDAGPFGLLVNGRHCVISDDPSVELEHSSRRIISLLFPSDNSAVLHGSGDLVVTGPPGSDAYAT